MGPMMNENEQQALALAATIQALSVVHQVATQGQYDETLARPVLESLVHYDPAETVDAYGGSVEPLRFGIEQLKKLFNDELDRDISQYLLAVLTIELRLVRSARMRYQLQSGLQRLSAQISPVEQPAVVDEDDDDDWGVEDILPPMYEFSDEALTLFAELYKETASQTEPRIMIKGDQRFLQSELSANQIRALLLAALRSAAFFRHYGGKRFDLMMKRGQYLELLDKL